MLEVNSKAFCARSKGGYAKCSFLRFSVATGLLSYIGPVCIHMIRCCANATRVNISLCPKRLAGHMLMVFYLGKNYTLSYLVGLVRGVHISL